MTNFFINIFKSIYFITAILLLATPTISSAKKKVNKIIIDAGHGGRDPGCRGVYSYEKDITLAVAKKLGKLILKELPDVKVAYTREYDWYPELIERTEFANREKGDLFISIHANSTPKKNSPVKGTLVLVCGPTRIDEKEGAIGKNANNFEENQGLLNPNDPLTSVIIAQYSQAFLSQSIVLGTKINDEFANQGRVTEGIRQQSLQVLASSAMPGVLVEIGYLNNTEEENYLNTEEGQNEVARAIFEGIKFYKAESEKEPLQIKIEN
ncbi:MAG: cell wall hydrolase/autolysin [Bacteroidetes bacterium OLB11]|mgnify:CR=1 FL=1|nr:MAG: cell wall hydrolase/autolysin [Bacteroidetes bacterium OLB11]